MYAEMAYNKPEVSGKLLYYPIEPANHSFIQDIHHYTMIVPPEEVTIDGSECDKIGVGYTTFRSQLDLCNVTQAQDCLHNQLHDKHFADVEILASDPQGDTHYLISNLKNYHDELFLVQGVENVLEYSSISLRQYVVQLEVDMNYIMEIDSDGDGIDDSIDNILGNSTNVQTNVENLTFSVDNQTDPTNTNGTATVDFKSANDTLVSFEYNFTDSTLDLSNITINKQEANAVKGSIIVKGIDLTKQNKTKTVYIDHLDQNANSICVKDSQIVSITEISENCTGADEFIINCPGTSNGYECVVENNRYKVSGLKHSGIKEFAVKQTINISLKQGWNLISIPLNPVNNSVDSILAGINYSYLLSYDSGWKIPTKINYTSGYWIKADNDCILTVEGLLPETTPFKLNSGWNLIGYPEEKDISALYDNVTVFTYNNSGWYSYNPDRPSNTFDKFTPGYGYWVKQIS